MGDVRHDSTFAFHVAKSQGILNAVSAAGICDHHRKWLKEDKR